MHPVPEYEAASAEQFRSEILPLGKPAVLRGLAADWPLVAAARESAEEWIAMLSDRASGEPVEIIRTDPENEGRFHYAPGGNALNFVRGRADLRVFLAALVEQSGLPTPYAMVVQGLLADRHIPGFAASHPMPLVPAETEPRVWIGNASKVATHNDPVDNVAVVVAGRRRFNLFPPDAEPDLYMGPAHPTPAGTPVSMVHVTAPDFERFPRFAKALEVGFQAELGSGDAIFIPKAWFHHVEALEPFNMLVNYWWSSAADR